MKKIYLFILVSMFGLSTFNLNAQLITEGTLFADVYYGYGSFGNSYFQSFQTSDFLDYGVTDVKKHTLGVVGVRGEYLLGDKIGLGFDIGYTSADVTGSRLVTESIYNPVTLNYDNYVNNYSYKRLTSKFSGVLTFNLHFLESEEFDLYFVAGLGYGNRLKTQNTDDPNPLIPTFSTAIPVTTKVGMGFRYFFNQNIGFNLATSLGLENMEKYSKFQ